MLHKVKYDVTFELTDRRLKNEVDFLKGFGTITGPNESGKSFLLEMVRWLLFGSAALRGSASDYRKISGELVFSVRGERYTVTRTGSQATLKADAKVLAVGTKPVNTKIIQVFGFGLDVFDMACVVNQMELVKLGQMRPAERKKMVDSVIGLGVIDDLTALASMEMTNATREANTMKDLVKEPVEPIAPEGFTTMKDIEAKYNELIRLQSQRDFLVGRTSVTKNSPVSPPEPPTMEEATALEQKLKKVQAKEAIITALSGKITPHPIMDKPDLDRVEKLLMEWEDYNRAQAWLKLHPKPKYTSEELDQFLLQDQNAIRYKKWQQVKKDIAHFEDKGVHTCPECGATSFLSHSILDELKAELAALPEGSDKPCESPGVNYMWHRSSIEEFLPFADEWEEKNSVPKPVLTTALTTEVIAKQRKQWDDYEYSLSDARRVASLKEELAMEPDYEGLLKQRRIYDMKLAQFQSDNLAYREWYSGYVKDITELDKLEKTIKVVEPHRDLYEKARVYMTERDRFDIDNEAYLLAMNEIVFKEEEADEWRNAKLGLIDFRTRVKQHLIPSLNVAASALIRQMTGGQRQRIEVDDDFEVRVDNQPLHTLSGSGMVVANLALRLGLGRVLTNGVFSVFIGDEIDSSMDATREKNTAETMRNLCGKVSQVLLITHKYPEADYYIQLGNTHEQEQS